MLSHNMFLLTYMLYVAVLLNSSMMLTSGDIIELTFLIMSHMRHLPMISHYCIKGCHMYNNTLDNGMATGEVQCTFIHVHCW